MYQRILVPVDGSPTADLALQTAFGQAKAFGAQLRLIHVLDSAAYLVGYDMGGASGQLYGAMREAGTELLQQAQAKAQAAGLAADTVLVDKLGSRLGDAVAEAARAWGADLVVLGTHGRRGASRLLLGSGAEQIIRSAPVPVLVVRGSDAAA